MASETTTTVLLAEYSSLRSEINLYMQRIDRIIGFYLTAVAAIAGYFMTAAVDVSDFLDGVLQSPGKLTCLLAIVIVNSLIVIIVNNYYLGILAMAQYIDGVLRPRLTEIAGEKVLDWDRTQTHAKLQWLKVRGASQILTGIASQAISVAILFTAFCSAWQSLVSAMAYVGAGVFFGITFTTLICVIRAGRRFQQPWLVIKDH